MNGAQAVLAILASAMIVLGGLAAVARMLFKVAIDIRDNKRATEANTKALGALSMSIDGRFEKIIEDVAKNARNMGNLSASIEDRLHRMVIEIEHLKDQVFHLMKNGGNPPSP